MNEIEKMYDNCNLLKPHAWSCKLDRIGDGEICELEKEVLHCKNCKYSKQEYYHKPFTAEKQIAIENIIFQCNFGVCELQRTMPAEFTKDNRFVKHYFAWQYHAGDIGYYDETIEEPYGDWDVECSNPDRKEALAGFVNALWDEYLTKEEKQQIKEILE